jgi:hypothetical protein
MGFVCERSTGSGFGLENRNRVKVFGFRTNISGTLATAVRVARTPRGKGDKTSRKSRETNRSWVDECFAMMPLLLLRRVTIHQIIALLVVEPIWTHWFGASEKAALRFPDKLDFDLHCRVKIVCPSCGSQSWRDISTSDIIGTRCFTFSSILGYLQPIFYGRISSWHTAHNPQSSARATI